MELLQEVSPLHGYHVEVLHDEGPAVIAAGLKYLHNDDMCYPATCAVGQQLYVRLPAAKYMIPHRVALLQFQTGGGCRASNSFSFGKSAPQHGHGLRPVISLSFGGYEHSTGFKSRPSCSYGLRSLIYGDTLMLLKNHKCLPYENQSR